MAGTVRPSLSGLHPSETHDAGSFLRTAELLAQDLLRTRLRTRDGGVTWRRPDRAAPDTRIAAGPHLYDGTPGIAVYLAALSTLGGPAADEYRNTALTALAPWRRLLLQLVMDPDRARGLRLEVGGLTGIGSFVYGLTLLSDLLETPDLLEEAHAVSQLMVREHIDADRRFDVVSGSAGAILALLALDRRLDGAADDVLPRAADCARHLLAHRREQGPGASAWDTDPRFGPLTGFAHGTTGIAAALLWLHRRTGDPELRAVALEALEFERSTWSPEDGDWLDPTSAEPRFLNQWCFGAPGLALGRLLALDGVDDPRLAAELTSEMERALELTARPELTVMDHLCCGGMGRADVLLYAYERRGDERRLEAARELAGRTLDRFHTGRPLRGLAPSEHRDPSLYSGEAGIGYGLLRLAHPHRFPCLLALA